MLFACHLTSTAVRVASCLRCVHDGDLRRVSTCFVCVSVDKHGSENSILCQAYRQLSSVGSRQMCVRLASGGDPTYAFNVRMTGEEVHGNSKTFSSSVCVCVVRTFCAGGGGAGGGG